MTTHLDSKEIPSIRKQSRAKIWIRTGILLTFAVIFGLTLYRDVAQESFRWSWALMAFLPSLAIGYWMSRLVPMQVYSELRIVTLSFDRIYFALIFSLVALKYVTGNLLGFTVLADVIISIILGLMVSRLSGICLRVHGLKKAMVLNQGQQDAQIAP